MIILSAIEDFYSTFDQQIEAEPVRLTSDGDAQSVNGSHRNKGKLLPHIISSSMEHPAVNAFLEHLEKSGKAGLLDSCSSQGGPNSCSHITQSKHISLKMCTFDMVKFTL